MSGPTEIAGLVRAWVLRADEDLEVREFLLSKPGRQACASVCFHAQQCVEKYLKALLVSRGIHFPWIHDIAGLLRLLPDDARSAMAELEGQRLTDYASVNRYPGTVRPLRRRPRGRDAATIGEVRIWGDPLPVRAN